MPCKNSQCNVDDDGKCIEGFQTLSECPHYSEVAGPVPNVDVEPGPGPEAVEASNLKEIEASDVSLSEGVALDPAEAGERMRSTGGIIVAVIGPTGSGKTTLVSSIYDLLGRGSFPFDQAFAGSDTLFAFERLCYLARAASGRDTPETEHTSRRRGLTFLHLELVSRKTSNRFHLLFTDRSGEDYEAAAHKREACDDLLEVAGADVILMLVDAQKLVNHGSRNVVVAQLRTMVESLVDAGLTSARQRLVVTLTKFDLVRGSIEEATLLSLFEHAVGQLRNLFGSDFAEIVQCNIASRPTRNTVEPGMGLKELLAVCTRDPVVVDYVREERVLPERTFLRVRE